MLASAMGGQYPEHSLAVIPGADQFMAAVDGEWAGDPADVGGKLIRRFDDGGV